MTRFLVDSTRYLVDFARFLRAFIVFFTRAIRTEFAFLAGIPRCGVTRAMRNARFCECAHFKSECRSEIFAAQKLRKHRGTNVSRSGEHRQSERRCHRRLCLWRSVVPRCVG